MRCSQAPGQKPRRQQAMRSESSNIATVTSWDGYWRLTRIHNLIPSALLVMLGAWVGSGHSFSALSSAAVWLTALSSGAVAVASVVINDYFDFAAGTDAPSSDKPLPSGAVTPDVALLLSGGLYFAVLFAACCIDHRPLRFVLAFSAAATLLYTPLFKRLTAVKNATVAAVIALAPVAGALAAGAGPEGLQLLAAPTVFAFCGIMYREMLMDLNDKEGDAASGVVTLPVLLGRRGALLAAAAVLLLGAGGAVAALLVCEPAVGWAAAAWGPGPALLLRLAAVVYASAKLLRSAGRVWTAHFDRTAVDREIEGCLKPIGLGMVMLAAVA